MKQEPVAWMMIRDGEFFDAIHPDEHARHEGDYTVPLYAAPRELSDEEIDSLITEYKIGEFSGFYVDKAMTESMKRRYKNVLDFARAILKKASEK